VTAHETINQHAAQAAATPGPVPALRRFRPGLITDWHLGLLAIVYVRQSTPQQILDHRESRERQYALVNHAIALGWPKDRILVIDDDQGLTGTTAEHRSGFHRILAEVTMEHVGLILGIEMSRLARSNKDWHHLLEMCVIFGAVLADEDGLYDPRDPNDRLLLGLKGTMSEYELVTMHNRLERGRLHKAERGELIFDVPCGYVKLPTGEVALDPDEQVRATVQLLFDKFDELGSFSRLFRYLLRNKIRLGTRVHQGPSRGQLEWRPATRSLVGRMLHHPIYAGAYSYGRRRVDRKGIASNRAKVRMREMPMSKWMVLQKDRLPAYITWERYLANQQRLLQNRYQPGSVGAPRGGSALLTGILVCGACGRRMQASYRSKSTAYYVCVNKRQAVEPENRLVARSLEQQWEKTLRAQRDMREEYDRFLNEQRPRLSDEERQKILALSADIPALWHAPETTARDRKEIIRFLTERIVVEVHSQSERAEVTITWRGGQTGRHSIVRTVSRYESLAEYDRMMDRIVQLRREGVTIKELAARLTREGYRTPRTQKGYTPTSVRQLLSRRGLTGGAVGREQLGSGEWWLPDLAKELGTTYDELREWALRGTARARRVGPGGPWIVWADGRERRRLRKVLATPE